MAQITVKQLAAAKRIAANVYPLTQKQAKLRNQITKLEVAISVLQSQIDAQEVYVKSFADGYTTSELLYRTEDKKFVVRPNILTWDEGNHVWIVNGTCNTMEEAIQAKLAEEPVIPEETVAEDSVEEAVEPEEVEKEEESLEGKTSELEVADPWESAQEDEAKETTEPSIEDDPFA